MNLLPLNIFVRETNLEWYCTRYAHKRRVFCANINSSIFRVVGWSQRNGSWEIVNEPLVLFDSFDSVCIGLLFLPFWFALSEHPRHAHGENFLCWRREMNPIELVTSHHFWKVFFILPFAPKSCTPDKTRHQPLFWECYAHHSRELATFVPGTHTHLKKTSRPLAQHDTPMVWIVLRAFSYRNCHTCSWGYEDSVVLITH